jgi:hypothetical protein
MIVGSRFLGILNKSNSGKTRQNSKTLSGTTRESKFRPWERESKATRPQYIPVQFRLKFMKQTPFLSLLDAVRRNWFCVSCFHDYRRRRPLKSYAKWESDANLVL